MKMKNLCFTVCFLFVWTFGPVFAETTITLGTLLDEMADRSAVARFPEPAYKTYQASSYHRNAVAPDQPGWFANSDSTHFVREDLNSGRREWVLMDQQGPGAIVRIWITSREFKSTLRFYIDGSETPAIEARADELIGGNYLAEAPFSTVKARGLNLYFPIPYQKSIKVTADLIQTEDKTQQQQRFYYQINYRTYTPDAKIVSFDKSQLEQYKDKINATGKRLTMTEPFPSNAVPGYGNDNVQNGEKRIMSTGRDGIAMLWEGKVKNGETAVHDLPIGSHAVHLLTVKIDARDIPQALRSTILELVFDDATEPQVFCPMGDFFGSGVGVNPYQSFYNLVEKNGNLSSYWVMPYRQGGKVTIRNHGTEKVDFQIRMVTRPWNWDERSMYFHSSWREQRDIVTVQGNGTCDWEYLKVHGKGVFVGDVLSLVNRDLRWWGEGDEKIYVDDESFPSHFGTGTEDYYGYAWCTPAFFEAPFHAQPRAEGPKNYGNITNLRVRSLDAIPFDKNFRFDMEIWHWAPTTVDYAVATFWYGVPQAKAVGFPIEKVITEAKKLVAYNSPPCKPYLGKFEVVEPYNGVLQLQGTKNYGRNLWKDEDHLFWNGCKMGDRLGIKVKVDKGGKQKLYCALTKAKDYGIVQFRIGDKKIGEPIDLFHETVVPTGEILVGEIDLAAGSYILEIDIIGRNEKSSRYYFGIDTFRFE